MSQEKKGFYVSLEYSRYGVTRKQGGISFQLTPTGVRYFYVGEETPMAYRYMARTNQKSRPRDISTQYNNLGGRLPLLNEKLVMVKQRLINHAKEVYPEFVIPDKEMHETLAWVAFPMLGAALKQGDLSTLAPVAVNLQVASGLRAFSVEEMVRTMFGEAPRQLQAAAAKSLLVEGRRDVNIDNLTLASLVRGYLPADRFVEILGMNLGPGARIQDLDKGSANEIRLLLRRFNPTRLMRILSGLEYNADSNPFASHGYMLLRDAAHQYADARRNHPDTVIDLSRQFKSIEELHDTVTHEYRKLKDPNLEIPYSDDFIERVSNITLPDGAKLVWPRNTHELVEWSSDKVMNNCIFSYGREAVDKACTLLGIVDSSGKMVVNVMIRRRVVVQCYGKANQRCADEAQIKALFDELINHGIINEEDDYKRWVQDYYRW